jgi:predicted transcriptional regulator
MSATFTVRIPQELKEKMKKLPAEWSEEVRKFIEERVKHLELTKTIEEIESRAKKRQLMVDSTTLIREDRER